MAGIGPLWPAMVARLGHDNPWAAYAAWGRSRTTMAGLCSLWLVMNNHVRPMRPVAGHQQPWPATLAYVRVTKALGKHEATWQAPKVAF